MKNIIQSKKLSGHHIYSLKEKGILQGSILNYALQLAGYPLKVSQWKEFINRLLLFLGISFTLSGVIFFFAYNWADMHKFAKLGILEAGIIIPIIYAIKKGHNTTVGKACILTSSIMVGAFLAVYGQIYQTGADAYQLFQGWALIILFWVIISRFTPLMMIFVIISNLAVILYWAQMIDPYGYDESKTLYLILGTGNFIIYVILELLNLRDLDWIKDRWIHRVMSGIILTILTTAIVQLIFDPQYRLQDISMPLIMLQYMVVLLWAFYFNLKKNYDIFILTLAIAGVITIITSIFIQVLMDCLFETGSFLLLSFVIVGEVACGAFILKNIHQKYRVLK